MKYFEKNGHVNFLNNINNEFDEVAFAISVASITTNLLLGNYV